MIAIEVRCFLLHQLSLISIHQYKHDMHALKTIEEEDILAINKMKIY